MRKPRDFDSELKALTDKQKQLKERKVHQLGELVIARGGCQQGSGCKGELEQARCRLLSRRDNRFW
jgi:hypothetical protein